jgi:nucleotide-binding universal stress UspA family protein
MDTSPTRQPRFRIVVGVDYSRAAKIALDHSVRLASQHGGSVLAVQVLPDRPHQTQAFLADHAERRDRLERYCHARCTSLLLDGVGPERFQLDGFIRYGRPDEQLRSFAARVLAQLIIVGAPAERPRWHRALRPTVADSLVSYAPCPVLVARQIESGTFHVGELLGLAPPEPKKSA